MFKAEIYCITSDHTKCYVGSTKNGLKKRLSDHKAGYKKWLTTNGESSFTSSFEVLEHPNIEIKILELCEFDTKKELDEKEAEWIKKLDTVNKNNPGAGGSGKYSKLYYIKNKAKFAARSKAYYEAHKVLTGKVLDEGKRARSEKVKAWISANKERVIESRKKYLYDVQCYFCGCKVQYKAQYNHVKSKKHVKALNDANVKVERPGLNYEKDSMDDALSGITQMFGDSLNI